MGRKKISMKTEEDTNTSNCESKPLSSSSPLRRVNFTLEQVMKAQRGSGGVALVLRTSALDWGGWLTPRPGRFNPGKEPVRIV